MYRGGAHSSACQLHLAAAWLLQVMMESLPWLCIAFQVGVVRTCLTCVDVFCNNIVNPLPHFQQRCMTQCEQVLCHMHGSGTIHDAFELCRIIVHIQSCSNLHRNPICTEIQSVPKSNLQMSSGRSAGQELHLKCVVQQEWLRICFGVGIFCGLACS